MPVRGDVLEWLDRVRNAGSSDASWELVYANAATPLIRTIDALIRIAKEAGGDADRFDRLCRIERVKDAEIVLQHLGVQAPILLPRLKLLHLPEPLVVSQIRFMARFLAPSSPDRLVEVLEQRFFDGIQNRTEHSARALSDELRSDGIALQAPESVIITELPAPLRRVIGVLQHSTIGLPAEVLAAAIACDAAILPELLTPLIQSRCVAEEAGRYRLMRRVGKVPDGDERTAVVNGLDGLIRYINQHHTAAQGRSLMPDAIRFDQGMLPAGSEGDRASVPGNREAFETHRQ